MKIYKNTESGTGATFQAPIPISVPISVPTHAMVVRCVDCKYWKKLMWEQEGRCENKLHLRTVNVQIGNREKFIYFSKGHRCVYGNAGKSSRYRIFRDLIK